MQLAVAQADMNSGGSHIGHTLCYSIICCLHVAGLMHANHSACGGSHPCLCCIVVLYLLSPCNALQAFDDCTTIASIFKLLDSFEGLLDRGVIAADLERKHLDLVRDYGQDLKEVADTFRETKDNPPLNKNAAPHSGRVTWVRGLKERVAGEHQGVIVAGSCVLAAECISCVRASFLGGLVSLMR